jgi:hypothetical protein
MDSHNFEKLKLHLLATTNNYNNTPLHNTSNESYTDINLSNTTQLNETERQKDKENERTIELDQFFPIQEITLTPKLKSKFLEDYYNVNILKKYPIKSENWIYTIDDIFNQYLKSKTSKFNILKKFKNNPNIKLITCKQEEVFKEIDIDLQMIYIQDILSCLKSYMTMSLNSILYTTEEKQYTFDYLDTQSDSLLKLLGQTHLLRFIVQTPYIVSVFFDNNLTGENLLNYNIFKGVIEDFIIWFDRATV